MPSNEELVNSAIKAFDEAEKITNSVEEKEPGKRMKAYDTAAQLLEAVWREGNEKKYGFKLVKALRRSKRYEDALAVSRELFRQNRENDYVKNSYAWVIYDYKIRARNEEITDEKEFLKAANAICEMTTAGKYSPYTATVMKVLDYLKKKTNRIDLEEEWLDRIQPADLSNEVRNIRDNGKNISIPSDKEKWFTHKSSVLYEKKDYMECIKCCDRALEELEVYSKNNEGGFFFIRKRALAKLNIPQLEESGLRDLEELLSRRPEWYIFSDLSSHFFRKGLFSDAYKNALFSLVYYPNKRKLVTVKTPLEILGKIFETREEKEVSAKHYALIVNAFKEEKFRVSTEYLTKATLNEENLAEKLPIKLLNAELQRFWIAELKKYLDEVHATVTKVLPDRRKVFAESEDRLKYSFRFANFQGNTKQLSNKDRVTLYLNPITSKKDGTNEAIIAEKTVSANP